MANQHAGPKRSILALLNNARLYLIMAERHRDGDGWTRERLAAWARADVDLARALIDLAPASTRRRWKAGR